MTTEELLALPEDGMERWLIRGQLREKPKRFRDRWHSRTMARLGSLLVDWRDAQTPPRGEVLGGIVGCRLERAPDTTMGVDLVYLSSKLAAIESDHTDLVMTAPTLAVEILALDDTVQEISERVRVYVEAGVRLVWVIDPHFRTVTVYKPGEEPGLFNVREELTSDPHLPGLRLRVESIFSR